MSLFLSLLYSFFIKLFLFVKYYCIWLCYSNINQYTRWGRRGGSNSDSESPVEEVGLPNQQLGHSQQPNSADFSARGSNFGGSGSEYRSVQNSGSIFQSRFHNSSTDQSHAAANSTPSPQLSLAEFLQNE